MKFNTRLGEIAEVIMGQSPKGDEVNNSGSGCPLLNGPTEFTRRHPEPVQYTENGRRFAEKGDLLFCVRGSTTGRMNYADQRYAIGRGIGAIRGKNGYPTPYLRAIIEQNLDRLLQAVTGSTFPNVGRDTLNNFEVASVDQDAASLINQFLVSLEDKIYLNSQINQTLEQMAQTIFKSWFVDFEPVKAKMAALQAGGSEQDALLAAMQAISGKDEDHLSRLQAEQPEQYAELKATAELFPSAMQDSELGEIPEGWSVRPLADLIEFNPRRILKKGTLAPYLDMKNVPTSGHLAEEIVYRGMSSGTKFINGDTLLARITPCLENGKTAYVDFLYEGQVGWGSTEYIVMRPQKGYPESIGYFVARDANFRQYAIQSMTGTSGRQRANAKALAELPWIIYPKDVVDAFDRIAQLYLRLARKHGDESKSLSQIRDTLLPKLLSGELAISSVTEAEEAEA
ncbi:type I restriction enzyme, S subunit [Nitrosomonas cryotolerans]|uniref:Type I restriction enzyme, S subunit n=1 Tax=Nitrosomonas cryotolerans ATCC 49181 TaxID=1131553 RepID=A0A1N6GVX9_9PROT|nr:restriction endonuclease subunit S [Nitrosomonas cryotolerans]SFP41719.1 type I restriction enzyme, S subunit [Nitrosomonas cryotolerans]SIO11741.1 type I restriction enzyme, S subunit [Nitrosomonas cryotolerans ATCC 49181]